MSGSIRDEAASLLASRGLTEAELRQRLLAKGFPASDVEDAVADARDRRWVDDPALARALLGEGVGKGRGKDRLLLQLEARGIAPEVAEKAWNDMVDAGEVDPSATLQAEVERRVGAEGGALTGKAATRIYNALLRSGHDPESIRSALAPYLGDDDDLP